jgi:zinc finger FYVE domain-containing protein 26
MYRFPTLNRWIQMQTNLHRVSEFAVTANQTADDSNLEARSSVKRVREHDTETESDADDINSSTIPVALTDLNSQGVEAADFWHDSSKSEASQLDTTVFLSFDWDNEEPYQKAVERYYT